MRKCTSPHPVNVTLDVIGGKWKPLILWHLGVRTMRFNELTREVTGVTQKMLTQQLRELEHEGLLSRKVFAEVPPRVEYSITEYGRTLQPVLEAMTTWGDAHTTRSQPTNIILNSQIYDVLIK